MDRETEALEKSNAIGDILIMFEFENMCLYGIASIIVSVDWPRQQIDVDWFYSVAFVYIFCLWYYLVVSYATFAYNTRVSSLFQVECIYLVLSGSVGDPHLQHWTFLVNTSRAFLLGIIL